VPQVFRFCANDTDLVQFVAPHEGDLLAPLVRSAGTVQAQGC
jgi:hypothetical protein